MRKLAFAFAAAAVLAGTAPASAQWGGWWGSPSPQSGNWAWGDGPYAYGYGANIGFYGGAPAAESYVYADRPRARRVVRSRVVTSYDPGYAYAYSPSYSYGGPYVGVGGPGFSVGFGFGPRYHPGW
jgi:hypothetical protein